MQHAAIYNYACMDPFVKGLSHIHRSHHGSSQIITPGSSMLSPASPCIHRAGIRRDPWRTGISGEYVIFHPGVHRWKMIRITPRRHRVHPGVSHPEDAGLNTGLPVAIRKDGLNTGLPVAIRKEHSVFQEWYGSFFIRVHRDWNLCRFHFLSRICRCAKVHAGCLPGVYIHGDAGDNTDDRGPMTRFGQCCDPWIEWKTLKNVHLSKKIVTMVLRTRTPWIKIRDDPCCDPWMCDSPLRLYHMQEVKL